MKIPIFDPSWPISTLTSDTMIWKQSFDLQSLNAMNANSLAGNLGIEFTEKGDDYLIARMPVDSRTVQPFRILHGGASLSLAETIGSVASQMCLEDIDHKTAVGLELNGSHLRAAKEGIGHVFGKVTPIRLGRTVHVWYIEISDEQGRKVCVSRLTMAIIDRR